MTNLSLTYINNITYNKNNAPIETEISLLVLSDGTNEGILMNSMSELFDNLSELCSIAPIRVFVYDLKNFFSYAFYEIKKQGIEKSLKGFDSRKRKKKLPRAYYVQGKSLDINVFQLRLDKYYVDFIGLNKYKIPEDFNLLDFGNALEKIYPDIFTFSSIPSYAAFKFTSNIYKFRERYPEMDLESEEYKAFDSLRHIDYGGFGGAMYNDMSEEKVFKNCVKYDRNSMYPSILYFERLPLGHGKHITDINQEYEKDTNIRFYHIQNLRGELPMNVIGGAGREDAIVLSDIWLYDFMLDTILKYATSIDSIDVIEAYEYETANISKFAMKYINDLFNNKNKFKEEFGADSAEAIITKLILNSIYGKFGQKPNTCIYDYYIDGDGYIRSEHQNIKQELPKYTYLPLAVFIVQKGWQIMTTIGNRIGAEHVHYIDTDCFIIDNEPRGRAIIERPTAAWCGKGKGLGRWKLEAEIEELSIKGIKQYAYITKDGKFEEANCGGGKHNSYDGINTFNATTEIREQLFIKGGAIYVNSKRG